MSTQELLQVRGGELKSFFDPRVRQPDIYKQKTLRGISPQELDALSKDVRLAITKKCGSEDICGHVENRNGEYLFTGEARRAIDTVSGAMATLLAHYDVVEFPKEKGERKALSEVLTDSALHYQGKHTIYAPVCPDYSRGDAFYKSIGEGISPEALGAINATRILRGDYAKFVDPTIVILVADTEDDIEEVMKNVVSGERTVYKARCEASARTIRESLNDIEGVEVMTFTQRFGDSFRATQLDYEVLIREGMSRDGDLDQIVQMLTLKRADRHSQILGRQEILGELTIRYMAQYMALGELISEEDRSLVMNYPTPNREYLNPAKNRFSQANGKVIPILGTIVER